MVATTLVIRHYYSTITWAMIKHTTNLQQVDDVSDLTMYEDPSFIHPRWVFAHFKIPSDRVDRFVEANECATTDETAFRHQPKSIPAELQSVPAAGKRFYKKGTTTAEPTVRHARRRGWGRAAVCTHARLIGVVKRIASTRQLIFATDGPKG